MVTYNMKKPEPGLVAAFQEARKSRPSGDIDRRTKEGAKHDHRGYRKFQSYWTPAEFRELSALADEFGESVTTTLRGLLRLVVSVEDGPIG